MVAGTTSGLLAAGDNEPALRRRILEAAFAAFMESGYATTSTLEIATRARVSKRELYALVGNKQEILRACITERAKRLDVPGELPAVQDRETLGEVLTSFGGKLVHEVSDPTVVAVFRLAIAEAVQAPQAADALNSLGRESSRAALRAIMARGRASGLITGHSAELAEQFLGLLWGDLMVNLLLGIAERPTTRQILRRARAATAAFLQLHARPSHARASAQR